MYDDGHDWQEVEVDVDVLQTLEDPLPEQVVVVQVSMYETAEPEQQP